MLDGKRGTRKGLRPTTRRRPNDYIDRIYQPLTIVPIAIVTSFVIAIATTIIVILNPWG